MLSTKSSHQNLLQVAQTLESLTPKEIHDEFVRKVGFSKPNPELPVLLTCEHASNRIPQWNETLQKLFPSSPPNPWNYDTRDQVFLESHWGYDPGAQDLTEEISSHSNLPCVLSQFSRLLIDPNRPQNSTTLIRTQTDKQEPIWMNQGLTDAHISKRLLLWDVYQRSLLHSFLVHQPLLVVSVHSFTRWYSGPDDTSRDHIEVGVLSTLRPEIAEDLNRHLQEAGLKSLMNEPYSGADGFMNSAHTLVERGQLFGSPILSSPFKLNSDIQSSIPVMLEIRQDLIVEKEWRKKFVQIFENALKAVVKKHFT